jgi:PKHD-type hydroxylase
MHIPSFEMVCSDSGCTPHLDLVWAADPLSTDLCETLQRLCSMGPQIAPTVVSQQRLEKHRVCRTRLVPFEPKTQKLYDMLLSAAAVAACRHYGLELSGISRMPHYVEYHAEEDGHFHWHNDYSHESDEAPRKLTLVIQLSHSDEYEGGDFEVFGSVINTAPRTQGSLFCLPSIIPHRVTPVTRGVRRALVAWVAGPRFR